MVLGERGDDGVRMWKGENSSAARHGRIPVVDSAPESGTGTPAAFRDGGHLERPEAARRLKGPIG